MAIPLRVEYYNTAQLAEVRLKTVNARFLRDKSKDNKYIYAIRGGYAMAQRNNNGSITLTYYKACPCGV